MERLAKPLSYFCKMFCKILRKLILLRFKDDIIMVKNEQKEMFWDNQMQLVSPHIFTPGYEIKPIIVGDAKVEKRIFPMTFTNEITREMPTFTSFVFSFSLIMASFHRMSGRNELSTVVPKYSFSGEKTSNGILPCLSTLNTNDTFRDFLNRTMDMLRDIYINQEKCPDGTYYFEEVDVPDMLIGSRILNMCETDDISFSIAFWHVQNDCGNALEIVYNTSLYALHEIDSIILSMSYMSEILAKNLDSQITSIPLIPPEEENKLLIMGTNPNKHSPYSVIDLFKENCKHFPTRIAVVDKEESCSFLKLDSMSNRIAHSLSENNVERGCVVAVLMPKTIKLIATEIAILKLGCIYIPLSVECPPLRVKEIMQASGCNLLCLPMEIRSEYENELSSVCKIIYYEDLLIISNTHENIECKPEPDDPAYVIYTSGTTGKPKGAVITHRSILNLVDGLYDEIYKECIEPIRVGTLVSPMSDVAVEGMYAALLLGHTLYLLPDSDKRSGDKIVSFLEQNKINLIDGTPTIFSLITGSTNIQSATLSLKYVLIGSEAFKSSLISEFKNKCPSSHEITIFNVYGATECCVDSVIYRVPLDGYDKVPVQPIGKPMKGVILFVMTRTMELTPFGLEGELYIGGTGVAVGYLNHVEQTINTFFLNEKGAGGRLYKTGDIVKWNENGNLSFINRKDSRVQVRGYRIQPQEVEFKLLECDGVRQATVIIKEIVGEKHIVAFISIENTTMDQVYMQIEKRLPIYMRPTYIKELDNMPVMVSGKVDVHALEKIVLHTPWVCEEMSDMQANIHSIWKEMLNHDAIGLEENFFYIGGHSLKAMSLASILSEVFSVLIDIRDIFNSPTIKLQALMVTEKTQLNDIIQIDENGDGVYPLISAQERIYIFEELGNSKHVYNLVDYYLIEGNLDVERMKNVLNSLVYRHESLRTSFKRNKDRELYQYVHDADIDFTYYDADSFNTNDIDNVIKTFISRAFQPFDLSKAPLIKAGLIHLNKQQHVLAIQIHHIICDATSIDILMKEFIDLYNGIELSKHTVQYHEYVKTYKKINTPSKFESDRKYWSHVLRESITLNLPVDMRVPDKNIYEGNSVVINFKQEMYKTLCDMASKNQTTPYIVLLATYAILLHKYCYQDKITIGMLTSGRVSHKYDNTVGMFANTLPICIAVNRDDSFSQLLSNVQAQVLENILHQDYPFLCMIEDAGSRIVNQRNPIFDVSFNFVYEKYEKIDFHGITIEKINNITETTVGDLHIQIVQAGEGITGWLSYNTALFQLDTVNDFARRFIKLLDVVLQGDDVPISNIKY